MSHLHSMAGKKSGSTTQWYLPVDDEDLDPTNFAARQDSLDSGASGTIRVHINSDDLQPEDEVDRGLFENKSRSKERLQEKILKIDTLKLELIKAQEKNVQGFLEQSNNLGPEHPKLVKLKSDFEKKSYKYDQNLNYVNAKLSMYHSRLRDLTTSASSSTITMTPSSSRLAKDVLKDVGQGIKSVMTMPLKSVKHYTNVWQQSPQRVSYGSADNIFDMTSNKKSRVTYGDQLTVPGQVQGRPKSGSLSVGMGFKSRSQEDLSPRVCMAEKQFNIFNGQHGAASAAAGAGAGAAEPVDSNLQKEMKTILETIKATKQKNLVLTDSIASLQNRLDASRNRFRQSLDEERVRRDHIQDQLNDLTELYQSEVVNIRQELERLEDKIEYEMDEKTRDLQDLLELCQTKITKMELQQHQQHLISMESFDSSNVRTIVIKLVNVFLALLAVVLIIADTFLSLLKPFRQSKLAAVVLLLAISVAFMFGWHWLSNSDLQTVQQNIPTSSE